MRCSEKLKIPPTPFMLATLLLGSIVLTGCGTTTRIVETKTTACIGFQPITYSSRDTPETIEQIVAHNAAWDAVCEQ